MPTEWRDAEVVVAPRVWSVGAGSVSTDLPWCWVRSCIRGVRWGNGARVTASCYVPEVPPLDSATRGKLPNSAFAYVDGQGRRRLPIHDAAHVRNALARFGQVTFEDDDARERARVRVLRAAKKFGIVPVGFITGQLHAEREQGRRRAREPVPLPSGFVTMLMTDIEDSTALVHRLGEGYQELLDEVCGILRESVERRGGQVVETRADEFFAVFESPAGALDAAVAAQRELQARTWVDGVHVRVRVGIHSGWPTRTETNYIGMAVHTAARVCTAAHGAQIVVTGDTREALTGTVPEGVRFRSLGQFRLRGIPEPMSLFQVVTKGLTARFPDLRI
jgi:class 3 adenylate cyclase